MRRQDLIERVDTWIRAAEMVASYARGSQDKAFLTSVEMSNLLQLRWFTSHNRVKIAIECNREVTNGDHWLGSYSIGGDDPYVLGFRAVDTLTDEV